MIGLRPLALIGEAGALTAAEGIARAGGIEFESMPLESRDAYHFPLAPALARFAPGEWNAFIAMDERAINHARLECARAASAAGYRLVSLVSPLAFVDPTAVLGKGVLVGPHASIGPGVRLGDFAIVRVASIIGAASRIGSGCTIGDSARVGRNCSIDRGSTIGTRCSVTDGVAIGRHCELLLSRPFSRDVPDRSFYDALLPDGARIIAAR